MDRLYARYACPGELLSRYVRQGRLGSFVERFWRGEAERDRREAERERERLLWVAYVHSGSDCSFAQWRAGVLGGKSERRSAPSGKDGGLDDAAILSILGELFPHRPLTRTGTERREGVGDGRL